MSEKKIMLGNEAIARGAYEAGVKVSAAYPGTPSTEISENIVNPKDAEHHNDKSWSSQLTKKVFAIHEEHQGRWQAQECERGEEVGENRLRVMLDGEQGIKERHHYDQHLEQKPARCHDF